MSRARRAAKPRLGHKVSTAKVRYARLSPRKVRAVADLIRGLTAAEAQVRLSGLHRPSSVPMLQRLIKSAVSNASTLEGASFDAVDLIIGTIMVDAGPVQGRFRPRAMGRAAVIRKKTTHVLVELFARP